ncbi:hypothetical protein HAD_05425 [Hyphomonas adhaerens MHS-3]|uniref:Uncharacterized protein n=1 Tax=Hyphomonas adhaerens MHS-3 TaxID=1280949 RepID=A0A069E916_9PROT|nr:hypothetical protein [Hyphomonas adhaerens]KCZ85096.1 hypothetical protein HAD_05425 [Hyphomonas adhaerens MHS-3]
MTFDARKANSASASGRQNALFALITLTVVCGAFFAVLSLPQNAAGHDTPLGDRVSSLTIDMPDLPGEAAEAYFIALGKVDPEAQMALSGEIMQAGKLDEAAVTGLVMAHAETVLRDHAGELAQADTKHVDDILDMTRNKLRTASRKRSKWCDAGRYADLADIEFQKPDVFEQTLAEVKAPLNDYSFDVMTGLMIAIEDARTHPVERGEMTRADEAALQGMVMSIMADPDVLPLIVSLQSGGDARKALKGVNVCNLGATAVTAAKTLPQETKGRLLAEAAREMKENGASAFRTGVAF